MPKIKEVTITGMEMVVQDNKLIDSPRFFSLQEQRLFILLVSKLNPQTPEDITFRLPTIEFAKALNITAHTVKAHLDNIYAKSNAHGKVAAVNYGLKYGLFD